MSAADLGWIARICVADAEQLGSLRQTRGLMVLQEANWLWLRGEELDFALSVRIRSIPDAEMFRLLPDRQLAQWDESVPNALLPSGDWQPLHEWIQPVLPQAGFPASIHERVSLRLIRCSMETASNMWCANWRQWRDYAIKAPTVRLNRFSFAVSENWEVLIRGTPLPPIPGRGLIERDGIVVPSGWRFDPDLPFSVVRQILNLGDSAIALFASDGSFEQIPESAFIQANRSAVRITDGQ